MAEVNATIAIIIDFPDGPADDDVIDYLSIRQPRFWARRRPPDWLRHMLDRATLEFTIGGQPIDD